jgi:hypothetical protein
VKVCLEARGERLPKITLQLLIRLPVAHSTRHLTNAQQTVPLRGCLGDDGPRKREQATQGCVVRRIRTHCNSLGMRPCKRSWAIRSRMR